MKELIEKMARELGLGEKVGKDIANQMLSVVLADIKESPERYVRVCAECDSGEYLGCNNEGLISCPTCKGKGLVAVEQGRGE